MILESNFLAFIDSFENDLQETRPGEGAEQGSAPAWPGTGRLLLSGAPNKDALRTNDHI